MHNSAHTDMVKVISTIMSKKTTLVFVLTTCTRILVHIVYLICFRHFCHRKVLKVPFQPSASITIC